MSKLTLIQSNVKKQCLGIMLQGNSLFIITSIRSSPGRSFFIVFILPTKEKLKQKNKKNVSDVYVKDFKLIGFLCCLRISKKTLLLNSKTY